jgi:hypothetical protein
MSAQAARMKEFVQDLIGIVEGNSGGRVEAVRALAADRRKEDKQRLPKTVRSKIVKPEEILPLQDFKEL